MKYKKETIEKRFERLEESRHKENERLMRDDTPSDTSEKETI
ncbi:hypothetical protein [Alistipes sp.]|nr:hypothetical protein [Alistipes sp.]